jgi:hypothetical protein
MDRKSLSIKVLAFLAAILFLTLGFFALWIAKTMLNMQQDAVLVAMLLVPILVYLIISGQLKELRLGGLSATFFTVAHTQLEVRNTEPITVEMVQVIMNNGGMPQLQSELQRVDRSIRYTVLTAMLGKPCERGELLKFLKALSQHRNFKFLVILDQDETVCAYLSNWRAIEILEMDDLAPGFIQALSQDRKQDLQRYGVINTTIETTDTNIRALEQMTRQKMEAIIVRDKSGKLEGVIEQDQVLSQLILAMARSI